MNNNFIAIKTMFKELKYSIRNYIQLQELNNTKEYINTTQKVTPPPLIEIV